MATASCGWQVATTLVPAIALMRIGWTRLTTRSQILALRAAWTSFTVLLGLTIGMLRGLDAQALMAALNPPTGSIARTAAVMLATPLIAARIRGVR